VPSYTILQSYFFSKNGCTIASTQGLWLAAPPITISFGCACRIEGAEMIANALTPAPLSAVLRVIFRKLAICILLSGLF